MKDLKDLNIPNNLKYDVEHEWISTEKPYRLGISDFAQDQLGDLTYVELPDVGASISKGDELGTLESTKSVSPFMSPVDGKVLAINEALADDPGLTNRDPYGEGWLVELELNDPSQLNDLFDAAAYKKHIETSGE